MTKSMKQESIWLLNWVALSVSRSVRSVEVWACPVECQRHMIIEYKLLIKNGEEFRQQIIDLKEQGYKTEPAFGILLDLENDPYIELLKCELS